jgi:hypothetical protein
MLQIIRNIIPSAKERANLVPVYHSPTLHIIYQCENEFLGWGQNPSYSSSDLSRCVILLIDEGYKNINLARWHLGFRPMTFYLALVPGAWCSREYKKVEKPLQYHGSSSIPSPRFLGFIGIIPDAPCKFVRSTQINKSWNALNCSIKLRERIKYREY